MADESHAAAAVLPTGAPLAAGTVTFLFTDIAGSTQLLQQNRQAYGAALAEHRRLLRAAFAAHGGREVDTQGDSFFVAFPTAGQAVAAAAEAQRSLAAQAWPGHTPVLVRMGLHTGEATVTGGGYVGLAVHRAARISAATHGGQVVLSEATAALVGDDLPDGTELHSLGEHRLKDFPQPAPLYQLNVDGLTTAFPPLRTTHRHDELPVPPGALLGRDAEVAALAALLRNARTRLVTVTGPGGIGKTRLAVETARTVADDFTGGAVFVPLSPVVDPRLVLSTIADVIGARREPGTDAVQAVRAAVGADRTLLVLDNFEQVVTAGSELARLLAETPAAVALVTSRRVLRLRTEQQFPLAPLAATAAERLFAERAAAVRPGFTLDAVTAPAVAEICRRLDGLPLAIELAAARIRLLPPAALLARLGERLDVLGSGPVDLPERQRTLRATMEWSFSLLRPHEQAVFTRLAVFSGGCTLGAAENVCGRPGEPDFLDTLSALLDASLLVESNESASEPRLTMLDTVRAYAAERLAVSPDRAETERRHTRWLLDMTDPLLHAKARRFREALESFDQERSNIRAAVQRAIDAVDVETATLLIRDTVAYQVMRDAQREVLDWLEQIAAQTADVPADARGRLLILRAVLAGVFNDFAAVRPLWEEGRRLLPDDDDHGYDHTLAAYASIFVALADGSVEEASRRIEETAARSAALGLDHGLTLMAVLRGHLAVLRGDLEGAARHFRAALELASRLGDEALVGQFLSQRGLVLLAQGDAPGARRSILDGAAANRRGGQPSGMAYSLEGLAALALADGRPGVTARSLAAAAAARQKANTPFWVTLQPLLSDLADRARNQLGDEAYEVACAEGRDWPALQALDRALGELADADLPPDLRAPAVHNPREA
jgi:predicted ATPase/class 3 adenylate cyclase